MSKLRLAVVGVGHLGRIHARLLAERDDVLLVGVADADASNRTEVAAACNTTAVADYQDLVDEVDAAIIATPTYTHRDVALAFLNRGLHVLVEKPLASSVREADDLVAAARRRKAVLQVGHVERFNPARSPRGLFSISRGSSMRPGSARFTARSTDIGAVLDLMIHDIDLMLTWSAATCETCLPWGKPVGSPRRHGQRPARIRERLRRPPQRIARPLRSAAAADADLGERRFRRHRLCRPHGAGGQPEPAVLRHEIDVAAMSPPERRHCEIRSTNAFADERVGRRAGNALADQHQDFLESIRNGREPRASGADGRDALVVAERVLAAIQAQLWGERANRATAPDAPPPVLRGPHWPMLNQPQRGCGVRPASP